MEPPKDFWDALGGRPDSIPTAPPGDDEKMEKQWEAEYARADLCHCGGITAGKKIAAIAEGFHVNMVPHNPLSPVGLAACLQLDAAIPNFAIQEYTTGFEAGVMESKPKHLGWDVVDHCPEVKDGFVEIPTKPGIGVELVPDAQKRRPPLVKPIAMRPHRDGFIVDQ